MDEAVGNDDEDDGVPKRPIVTTLVGLMVVGWLCVSQPAPGVTSIDVMMAVAAVQAVLVAPLAWLVCFAIRLRKASAGWNVASFMLFCLFGFFVHLGSLAREQPAPPVAEPTQETRMIIPGVGDPRGLPTLPSVSPHRAHRHARP